MAKADHMLSILWMLRQRKRTAAELAAELELSIRSVYRYIDALCASGVPVMAEAGPGGGYSLPEHTGAAPLFFDTQERRALVQASAFARGCGYPYEEALERAIAKIQLHSNDAQLAQMGRDAAGIEMLHTPGAALSGLLAELEASAADGFTLQMDYRKADKAGDRLTSRQVDPYGLVFWKGQWYMAGYCHMRGDIRNFRVDRIAGLQRTEARFARPAAFSAREFLLRALLPDREAESPLVTLIIESHEEALNDLCSHWLFGHILVTREPGQAQFLLDEATLDRYVPYYLLPYGKALKILKPVQLNRRLEAVAAGLADYYSEAASNNYDC
ncbi:helix-turn-helix transcriptional regulator [Paenibacillus tengchongensis]|uniref:helix-turn-helix transcriptional regulator n=1 Tax=Paenibacillus tengchongensis TaxID=2608684 RepID=UPI00124C06B9|nr:WYL domain-containing protein [Paenibacillus tengchongensis]